MREFMAVCPTRRRHPIISVRVGCGRWCASCSSIKGNEVHDAQHLLQRGPLNIFGHDVGWILDTRDFVQRDRTGPDFLLTPEVSGVEMPDLAESATSADAERCGRISVNSNAQVHTQISRQALNPEAMGYAGGDAMEFGFTRRQCNGRLGLAPMLHASAIEHDSRHRR